MADAFQYDVFLSHSSKDKAVVRAIAERLRADGLRVWLDEWKIRPGDHIPWQIEEGLEKSRVLVLCMSAHASGSEWARLEAGTFRFRDPLNMERCFIPLRLDEAPIKGSFAQFCYINWLADDREKEYVKLLDACRPPQVRPLAPQEGTRTRFEEKIISLGHTAPVSSVAISSDGTRALSGSWGNVVRLWDIESGRCLRILEGHTGPVNSLAWSDDEGCALSGSEDRTVRFWDVNSGRCFRVLEGHADSVLSVAFSGNGERALSGSADGTARLWDLESGSCLRVFEGHSDSVRSVAWNEDGDRALSGSDDRTVRLWDIESGRCLRAFGGHARSVRSVAWSGDGTRRPFRLGGRDGATVGRRERGLPPHPRRPRRIHQQCDLG